MVEISTMATKSISDGSDYHNMMSIIARIMGHVFEDL